MKQYPCTIYATDGTTSVKDKYGIYSDHTSESEEESVPSGEGTPTELNTELNTPIKTVMNSPEGSTTPTNKNRFTISEGPSAKTPIYSGLGDSAHDNLLDARHSLDFWKAEQGRKQVNREISSLSNNARQTEDDTKRTGGTSRNKRKRPSRRHKRNLSSKRHQKPHQALPNTYRTQCLRRSVGKASAKRRQSVGKASAKER